MKSVYKGQFVLQNPLKVCLGAKLESVLGNFFLQREYLG